MIITVFSEDARIDRTILATNLATQFARDHHKIALIDASRPQSSLQWERDRSDHGIKPKFAVLDSFGLRSELENPRSYLRTHYHEIIVDADGVDALATDAALVSAHVLLIPAWFADYDKADLEKLIDRLESVRLFNPGLRVLVLDVRTISASSDGERIESAMAENFAARVYGARVAQTVLHERLNARRGFDDGLSVFEDDPVNERAAAEIKQLYQEIVRTKELPPIAPDSTAMLHAIQKRFHSKVLA